MGHCVQLQCLVDFERLRPMPIQQWAFHSAMGIPSSSGHFILQWVFHPAVGISFSNGHFIQQWTFQPAMGIPSYMQTIQYGQSEWNRHLRLSVHGPAVSGILPQSRRSSGPQNYKAAEAVGGDNPSGIVILGYQFMGRLSPEYCYKLPKTS